MAGLGVSGATAQTARLQIAPPDTAQGAAGQQSAPVSADSATATLPQRIEVQPQADAVPGEADGAMPSASSLADLVAAVPVPTAISRDLECLAGAIYFEAKSESLAGQLAVGRVVVARTASGRFPASYCGVVMQHAQFSFVHGGVMPSIDRAGRAWQNALRIALIADRGAWKSPAEGALFFHAARIGAVAGKTRVARIDNHVFYR